MDLPNPPDWKQARTVQTIDEWILMQFAQVTLGGLAVPACLACAALVVPGCEARHYQSLHAFKGL